MVPCVKCPIAFDVLALYALTNFIGELRFTATCIVGWVQYNSEKSCGALRHWWSWGQWGEELPCGEEALGRIAGEGAAHGTPDKVSCSDRGSVYKLQLCKFSVEFSLF